MMRIRTEFLKFPNFNVRIRAEFWSILRELWSDQNTIENLVYLYGRNNNIDKVNFNKKEMIKLPNLYQSNIEDFSLKKKAEPF